MRGSLTAVGTLVFAHLDVLHKTWQVSNALLLIKKLCNLLLERTLGPHCGAVWFLILSRSLCDGAWFYYKRMKRVISWGISFSPSGARKFGWNIQCAHFRFRVVFRELLDRIVQGMWRDHIWTYSARGHYLQVFKQQVCSKVLSRSWNLASRSRKVD